MSARRFDTSGTKEFFSLVRYLLTVGLYYGANTCPKDSTKYKTRFLLLLTHSRPQRGCDFKSVLLPFLVVIEGIVGVGKIESLIPHILSGYVKCLSNNIKRCLVVITILDNIPVIDNNHSTRL